MVTHAVAVLALDRVVPLDLSIPAGIFGEQPDLPYRLTVCGRDPEVATTTGFSIRVPGTLDDARRADTLIVPGYTGAGGDLPDQVLDTITQVHARGGRVVSICSGAFALAAAGLLDGRRATTHWSRAAELARRYPRITVDPHVLYVDEGQLLTSAGVSAGIDLCLYLVRRDHGAAAANRVARNVVAAPHRDGGQAQFIASPVAADDDAALSGVRAWALAHLDRPVSVPELARHAAMAPRTFARRFVAETGHTPLQWLLHARIDRARELLESSTLSIGQIADSTGLGSAINLRVHFRNLVGTTPSAYRRAFRTTADVS
ncbi:GlxA family transcriptional regulator [Actinoplanes teichomyceticus]|uniref:AdpA6 n=1 Tax=Actinoplanes teichomyceticus TaxID=1867 RepID=A0A0K0UT63_ACTTI|nr:helix-turn-helix domain-containing protein [Actinoplanes teichomyceticus]AKR67210.1 AdpA6 [Actinoplanes teichomyceticus]TWG10560.1 transcriptional regulator GlxA family with amidase domain [Actinoplanes teichomyceticus]GIF15333.1 AraC family transcriptional regulator [Actinoplanes teichomyceticus]